MMDYRILLITAFLPWPVKRHGGAQRTRLMLEALRRLGKVELMQMLPAGWEQSAEQTVEEHLGDLQVAARIESAPPRPAGSWRHLARIGGPAGRLGKLLSGMRSEYTPDANALSWLKDQISNKRYDLIVCRNLRPAMLAGAGHCFGIPRILDLDDIDWHILANQIRWEPWPGWKGRVAATLAVRQIRGLVRTLARRFNGIWVTNEEDRAEVALRGVRVLPNIPFRPPGGPPIRFCPLRPESKEIFFIGDLSFLPNREGLEHFLQRVWPVIRRRIPDAVVRIGGIGLDTQTRNSWAAREGVEIIGFVEDLQAEYDRCAITIAPIQWGAGTKIKVLESLAYGRTCVVTPHALHGHGCNLRHGESIWCGETDEAMAEGCTRLLDDPDLRTCLADVGHSVILSKYSVKSFEDEVLSVSNELLACKNLPAQE